MALSQEKLSVVTIFLLAAGTFFAWTIVVIDFRRFFDYGGDWLVFSGTMFPHPVTTSCFYGAFAFLAAFVWAWRMLKISDAVYRARQWLLLVSFLIAGTIFAWTNTGLLLYRFYTAPHGEGVSCSGVLITNPFITPCFIGAVLFLLSLAMGIATLLYYRNEEKIRDTMLQANK